MWVIQGDLMVRLPEGAPIPPGSISVDPPKEFNKDPRSFVVEGGELKRIERKAPEGKLSLSQEEIARIKKAIADGVI